MYCNEGGRCVKYKEVGERCTSNEACGRKSMCIFETTLSTYGMCREILSMSENTLVLPMYKADMADTDTGLFVYQQDFEKVCRSGYLNQTSGRCVTGLKSKNKGGVCMSDLDCPTTDPAIFAKCKCGHTSKGTKYCDIEGGDDEWTEAYALVRLLTSHILSSRSTSSAATTATRRRGSAPAIQTNTIINGSARSPRPNSTSISSTYPPASKASSTCIHFTMTTSHIAMQRY